MGALASRLATHTPIHVARVSMLRSNPEEDIRGSARHKTLVSIGVPVYNGERYLTQALESLLAQDYADLEVIVSDNGSSDGTEQVCRRYVAKDVRIHYERSEVNRGAFWNFNRTLELATGGYFMWAACDDYWEHDFVSSLVQELESHPECGAAMCAVERVSETGERIDAVRHTGEHDPSTMGHFALAMALAAGRPYHLFIYGLYRRAFLRRAFPGLPSVIANDRLFVCQVALATRLRYVDRVLHRRLMRNERLDRRYAAEALGAMWSDPAARRRLALAAGPYLLRSPLIPLRRKLLIPVVVCRFAAWNLLGIRAAVRGSARRLADRWEEVRGKRAGVRDR